MPSSIKLAVVGHANVGKTSLLRTLARRRDFGKVSDRPGTTRHVESIDLLVDGTEAIRFLDTPGLEDSTDLLEVLRREDHHQSPPDRIRSFLRSDSAQKQFEQEAKVLRAMLEVDAAFYVIDTREPVLPKYECELEILSWCARPVMPVLNFVRDPTSRVEAWTSAVSKYGLHVTVQFDVVAPFVGSEQRLYNDLATLLRASEAQLTEVWEYLELERLDRRTAAYKTVADLLVAVASARTTVTRRELQVSRRRNEIIAAFRASVFARSRIAIEALLEIYAFGADEARIEVLPWLDGRWQVDLFNPESLKGAGRALGTGALVGASIGLAADVALAGLSLGTGAAIGAAVGGVASQGFGAVGRTMANKLLGRTDLTVEDEVLVLLADQMLTLMQVLEQRGHAAVSKVELRGSVGETRQAQFRSLQAILSKARAHPDWATGCKPGGASEGRRAEVLDSVVSALRQVVGRRQA